MTFFKSLAEKYIFAASLSAGLRIWSVYCTPFKNLASNNRR